MIRVHREAIDALQEKLSTYVQNIGICSYKPILDQAEWDKYLDVKINHDLKWETQFSKVP